MAAARVARGEDAGVRLQWEATPGRRHAHTGDASEEVTSMADKLTGELLFGANDRGEIIINLTPETVRDFSLDTGGHLVFSPNQARNLAHLLLKHSYAIDGQTYSSVREPTILDIIKQGSIQCGNCGTYRAVSGDGTVKTCGCGDDEWNLFDAADAIVP